MFGVLLIYLLLALHVRVCFALSISQQTITASIDLRLAGVLLLWEIEKPCDAGMALKMIEKVMERLKKRNAPMRLGRFVRRLARNVWRSVQVHALDVKLRVGCAQAWQTAMVVGGVKATLLSVMGALDLLHASVVRLVPDYAASCFCLDTHCIISVTLGDIMLGAVKAALMSKEKGASSCSSTLLKA